MSHDETSVMEVSGVPCPPPPRDQEGKKGKKGKETAPDLRLRHSQSEKEPLEPLAPGFSQGSLPATLPLLPYLQCQIRGHHTVRQRAHRRVIDPGFGVAANIV